MREADFQAWVVEVAERFGWRVWHVPTPMRPIGQGKFVPDPRGRGLPDLILLHDDPPRLIFAEVKNEAGVLSDDQREFLKLAKGVAESCLGRLTPDDNYFRPIGVYTWRPGVEELIEATLRGKVMSAS